MSELSIKRETLTIFLPTDRKFHFPCANIFLTAFVDSSDFHSEDFSVSFQHSPVNVVDSVLGGPPVKALILSLQMKNLQQ